MARSPGSMRRYSAIAAALDSTARRDWRTSLGDPVDPEVLSSRARSWWSSWRGGVWCAEAAIGSPAPATTSGVHESTRLRVAALSGGRSRIA